VRHVQRPFYYHMRSRGLIERADNVMPLYQLTPHGKAIAAAVVAYRREMEEK
jgi:hypothetical protein